jgi:hypothetical protein
MSISKNKKKNHIHYTKKKTIKSLNLYKGFNTKNKKLIKRVTKRTQKNGQLGGNAYNIDCRIENFDYGTRKNQKYAKGIWNVRDCEYIEDKLIKHLYGKNFVGIPIIEKVINDIRMETYKNYPNGTKYKYNKLTRYERLKHLVFTSIENNPDIPDEIKTRVSNKFYSGFIGMFKRLARSNKESELYDGDDKDKKSKEDEDGEEDEDGKEDKDNKNPTKNIIKK